MILFVTMGSGFAVDVGGLLVKPRGNLVGIPRTIFRFARKQFVGF